MVGIVGFGLSAECFHAPFIYSNSKFILKKVVERHSNLAKKQYPEVEIERDYNKLLSDPFIDLIVITTPNIYHFSMVEAALQAGKHVVVEKPFTVTTQEADRLIQLAQTQGKVLAVYQNRRWDGDYKTIKSIIKQGLLGEVVEYEAHFDRYRNFLKENTWKEEPLPGSGIVYDLGAHLIDQAVDLFGLPHSVTGYTGIQRSGSKICDSFDIRLDYNRIKVVLKAGMLIREPGPRFMIHGTKGSFLKYGMDVQEAALRRGEAPITEQWGAEPKEQWGLLHTEMNGLHFNGKVETIPGSYQDFYTNVYNAMVSGEELVVKPEQARNVIRIIELVQKSSEQKTTLCF